MTLHFQELLQLLFKRFLLPNPPFYLSILPSHPTLNAQYFQVALSAITLSITSLNTAVPCFVKGSPRQDHPEMSLAVTSEQEGPGHTTAQTPGEPQVFLQQSQ
jgi:hypothetical protein